MLLGLSGCWGGGLLSENITVGPQSCVRKNAYYNTGVNGQISIVFPQYGARGGGGSKAVGAYPILPTVAIQV